MKKLSLFLCAALMGMMFISCGSSKQAAKDEHCCMSTKDDFKAKGSYLAKNRPAEPYAEQAAMTMAREELATMMEATIARVIENYSSNYIDGDAVEFKASMKGLSRTVVKQKVKDTKACDEWVEVDKDGSKMFYKCVKMSASDVLNEVNDKVSKDAKLRTDYEYEKFKQTFEKEMEKLAE